MIFSCVILIVFGIFLGISFFRSGISKAHEIVKQRNYAVNWLFHRWVFEVNNTIEILADNKDVQDLPWLDLTGRERVLNLLKSYSKANKNITYVYSGYENKELLINDYTPPDKFDPTLRPWYQAAMAVKPEYQPAFLSGSKKQRMAFGTSKALFSEIQRIYTGVVSSDSSIQMVVDMLNQRGDVYKTSYSFVTKLDGEVILHHQREFT